MGNGTESAPWTGQGEAQLSLTVVVREWRGPALLGDQRLPLEGMGEPAGAARAMPQDASSWSCRLGDASLCHVGLALLCTAVTAVSAPHAVLIVSPREMEVLVSYRHYRVMSSPTSVP